MQVNKVLTNQRQECNILYFIVFNIRLLNRDINFCYISGTTLEVKEMVSNKSAALCQFDPSLAPDTKIYM